MRVLVVEDDEALCKALGVHLQKAGYAVDSCLDGETGLYYARQGAYGCILLDRMLPALDGIALLRALRSQGLETPVLLLTALDAVGDRVAGLDAGADDYLAKPFAVEELLARVRALARRPRVLQAGGGVRAGDLQLDEARKALSGPAGETIVSKTEAGLLGVLLQNPGQILPRELLYVRVWGPAGTASEQSVDNYVHFVRRRLKSVGSRCTIETVRAAGYRLRLDGGGQ